MNVLLGLDIGTTNCKVLAVGEDGQPIASATAPTPTTIGNSPDAAPEFDANALWQVSARLIREAIGQLRPDMQVAGIAVASIGESIVLVDRENQPLAPIIIWHDVRTLPWLDWWRERISERELYRITGLNLGHIYSANKLFWYREHQPDIFRRAQSFLSIADWITLCLSGQHSMSCSLASRTLLFDLRARAWSDQLLRLAEIPDDLAPPIVPGGQVVGRVTLQASQATSLPAGTPVVAGGHDHTCAALAAGVIGPGMVLDSSGTVEAILVSVDAPILDVREPSTSPSCGCHSVPGRYCLIGGIMSGAIVDWMARLFNGNDSASSVEHLMSEAASASPGSSGVWFEPYLGGSGPPTRNPDAWGAWLGLRINHTRADIVRAGMEGLTFGIRTLLEGVLETAGAPALELRAVGGGTRNSWWQALKADILGIPIQTLAVSDVTAQGAALLAGIGVGIYANAEEAAARAVRFSTRYEPGPENHARYEQAYLAVFQKLYPLLKAFPIK
jgi:xylulokinase